MNVGGFDVLVFSKCDRDSDFAELSLLVQHIVSGLIPILRIILCDTEFNHFLVLTYKDYQEMAREIDKA